jgi:hypothetical protein
MTPREVRDALVELAREAGLEVRMAPEPREGAVASGICRLRGRWLVILAAADPVEEHVAVLARALRVHAPGLASQRFLPPAVRARLEGEGES